MMAENTIPVIVPMQNEIIDISSVTRAPKTNAPKKWAE